MKLYRTVTLSNNLNFIVFHNGSNNFYVTNINNNYTVRVPTTFNSYYEYIYDIKIA